MNKLHLSLLAGCLLPSLINANILANIFPRETTATSSSRLDASADASYQPTRTSTITTTSTTIITEPSETILSGTNTISEPPITTVLNGTLTGSLVTVTTITEIAQPTNTQPCNLYLEFCTRSYGNITFVAAHNSPFVRENNAAANQELDVVTQLNDGIRMLQGQTHMVNNTLYYCHTSCDLLNAGTVESYLTTVTNWIKSNPYEVVTILIGNGDFVDITLYQEPLENSGLADIAYIPTERHLNYTQWPTLSELILSGKRAIVFMDYKADQTIVPYILDEFTYMFETPFSQTNASFPCNVDRPPDQPKNTTMGKLYMANHNLNVNFSLGGVDLLVPNTVELNVTNGVSGFGSLGLQANTCESDWGRYPNFLLVDFYNYGNGSVFEVAAMANNVTYDGSCCGKKASAGNRAAPQGMEWIGVSVVVMVVLALV
ncbi:hypothetical protein RUND412_010697 [Rhizina undulata]